MLMTPVLAGLPEGTVTRGESGVKIGTGERGTTTPRGTRGSSAVKIGEGGFPNSTRKRVLMTTSTTTAPTTTITTTMLPSRFTYTPQSSVGNNHNSTYLKVRSLYPSFSANDLAILYGICLR